MKRKKAGGIESIKRRYGLYFTLPWMFGLAVFVIKPLFTSFYYAFADVTMGASGLEAKFVGLKHLKELFFESATYVDSLFASVVDLISAVPIIMVLSLCLALILNQKFHGRAVARAVFFLPVIISTGAVQEVLNTANMQEGLNSVTAGTSQMGEYMQVIDFADLLYRLNLPTALNDILSTYLSDTINLIWSCGVQILLFVAGLQTIPDQLYEAGKVEGATKWEEFWFITLPSLGRVFLLVLFYTMIELFLEKGAVVQGAITAIEAQKFQDASAMIWPYFLLVGIAVGGVALFYTKTFLKKWE